MKGDDQGRRELPDAAANQQIHLEEVRKARIEAEVKREKQLERRASRKRVRAALGKMPTKVLLGIIAVLVAAAIIFFGFVLPYLTDDHNSRYVTDATLKEAMGVGDITAIDYTYKGIAVKKSAFLWFETVDYRVKYEARVRVSYDMSAIEPEVDEDKKVAIVYLPDAVIGEPRIDGFKLSFLPENPTVNMDEVLALCEEDVAAELKREEMQREASESLQDTVKALTMPLLGEEYQLEFKSLSEYRSAEGEQSEAV